MLKSIAAAVAMFALAAAATLPATANADAQIASQLAVEARSSGTVQVVATFESAAPSEAVMRNPRRWTKRKASLQEEIDEAIAKVKPSEIDVVRRFRSSPVAVVEVTPKGLRQLSQLGRVEEIGSLTLDEPTLHQSSIQVQASALQMQGLGGDDQAVAVIDTGVQSAHQFLTGKVLPGACFTNNGGTGVPAHQGENGCPNGLGVQFGGDAGEPCVFSSSGCGHGTHVAGIVAGLPQLDIPAAGNVLVGMAPDAEIIPYQVFTVLNSTEACAPNSPPCLRSYNTDQLDALEEIEQRVLDGAEISSVNMSLGGGEHAGSCNEDMRAGVIERLRTLGVAVAIASGNQYSNSFINAPGCIDAAITVGSVTKTAPGTAVSSFSNHTDLVDLMAPGSAIRSSNFGGGYVALNGTSMATPHVAGAWAQLAQRFPDAAVPLIETALEQTGPVATRNGVGKPVIRLDDAADWLESNPCFDDLPESGNPPTASSGLLPAQPGPGGVYDDGIVTLNIEAEQTLGGNSPRCIQWRFGSSGALHEVPGSQASVDIVNGSAIAQSFEVQFRSVDWSGNAGAFQSIEVSVRDGVAPSTTHSLTPTIPNGAAGWYIGTAPTMTLSAVDNFADEGELDISYRLGTSGPFAQYTGSVVLPANTAGTVVQYRAVDPAGNLEPIDEFTVKSDVVAPATTATPDATWVFDPETINVSLDAADGLSGLSRTYYCVAPGASGTCTPAITYVSGVVVSGLGFHTVRFRSIDNAGNLETVKQVVVEIRAVPLVAAFDSYPESARFGDTFEVVASINGDDPAELTASGFCEIITGAQSPVLVKASGIGSCSLVADGPDVVETDEVVIEIDKAIPDLRFKAIPKKVKSGKRAKLQATLRVGGMKFSEGEIEFRFAGKRRVVEVSANGRATTRFRVKAKPGKKMKLRARHLGSEHLETGQTVKVSLPIR